MRNSDQADPSRLSSSQLFAIPWIVTHQAPLSIEVSRILDWVAKKSVSEYFYVSIDSKYMWTI